MISLKTDYVCVQKDGIFWWDHRSVLVNLHFHIDKHKCKKRLFIYERGNEKKETNMKKMNIHNP